MSMSMSQIGIPGIISSLVGGVFWALINSGPAVDLNVDHPTVNVSSGQVTSVIVVEPAPPPLPPPQQPIRIVIQCACHR